MPAKRWWIVAALLLVFLGQLAWGLRSDGSTADELTYIGAGFRHLHGDFTIDPDHPPLAKMIGALPLLVIDAAAAEIRPGDDQDGWGYRFAQETNRSLPILRAARVSAVVVSLLLAILVFVWVRQSEGSPAPSWSALLALGFVAFQPAFLAHGHLATTDMLCVLTMVFASWTYWRFERQPTLPRAALVAGALGLAMMMRLTTLILLPALAVLALVRFFDLPRTDRGAWTRSLLKLAAAHLVVVPLVIWCTYGFRYSASPGPLQVSSESWPRGTIGGALAVAAEHRLLPQAFLEGIAFQARHESAGHPTYLLGERSKEGWWYYYVVVLLVKSTPGFLLLMTLALTAALRHRERNAAWRHWAIPAAVVLVAASAAHVQLGERYILPAYAYLILWASTTLSTLLADRRGRALLAATWIAHAVPALLAAGPGYLTYFNAIAGRWSGGHRFLADSNLDWGQDLPRLARWMREHHVARIQLGYFGSDDPDRYGIAREDLPTWPHSHRRDQPAVTPFTGTVVVSPNLALGYLFPPDRNPYERLRGREPDERAGIFFVYRLGGNPVEKPAENPVDSPVN